VVMMAARYDNDYVRTSNGWRISRMVHTIAMTNFLPLTSTAPAGLDIPPAVAP